MIIFGQGEIGIHLIWRETNELALVKIPQYGLFSRLKKYHIFSLNPGDFDSLHDN